MARRHPTTAFGQLAGAIALGRPGHIVDTLIAERGEKIVKSPFWPLIRPFLHILLRYHKAIKFADDIAKLPGFQSFEYMSGLLDLDISGEAMPSAFPLPADSFWSAITRRESPTASPCST
jgi:putative hemolysin